MDTLLEGYCVAEASSPTSLNEQSDVAERAVRYVAFGGGEGLSPRLRKTLSRFGLLDAAKVAALEPLTKHVDGEVDAEGRVAFVGLRQAMTAKGTTAKQVDIVAARVKRVIQGCRFVFWSDISASRVMSYLDGLRDDKATQKATPSRA